MTTLIKNGTVVTAGDTFQADVVIDGEQVAMMGRNLPEAGHDDVIDATGLLLLPGGIDVHTHLELPFGGTGLSGHGREKGFEALYGFSALKTVAARHG